MLNLKNTLDGYLKNVEVIGNTIQDTNNLANIRSVGDKVEGQELYNISIQVDNGDGVNEVVEILSPVQLEKVGGVADRIICKYGVWGIEKNTYNLYMTNFSDFSISTVSNVYRVQIRDVKHIWKNPVKYGYNTTMSNFLPFVNGSYYDKDVEHYYLEDNGSLFIFVDKNKFDGTVNGIVDYFKANPNFYIKVQLAEPQFIPLPHDQQVKLRTFAGQTNIAFLTEIPGQIKAQVPKSLGATVNTHTEQIADLHNSLERVKKLEETTVSTVETESNFTTVDATSNGYFEDVKLEGKTLVNKLINPSNVTLSSGKIGFYWDTGYIFTNKNCYDIRGISNNFTIISTTGKPVEIAWLSDDGTNVRYMSARKNVVCDYIELPTNATSIAFYVLEQDGWTLENALNANIMLLEGDHTNNPPGYHKGLMSVGQDVEEVGVESRNSNLFNAEQHIPYGISNKMMMYNNTYRSYYIECEPNTSYFVRSNCSGNRFGVGSGFSIQHNGNSFALNSMYIGTGSTTEYNDEYTIYRTGEHDKYLFVYVTNNGVFNKPIIHIEKSTEFVEYKDVNYNKKPLLYYNPTTETWKKPILREWDSIEKHSDGKYYYHKRSEEVVLNGSESWMLDKNNTTVLAMKSTKVYGKDGDLVISTINTHLPNSTGSKLWADDIEGVGLANTGGIKVNVAKSKLSTQDEQGFKQWLQANNVTVVYQLAKEEVYECTNIDLMTYSGETNYIINSGAISPKSLLKVHNNISNVVKILQEKVSLLENTFIAGLKSVLSGDMYSLATILYPEDFEQNDNTEQDIMVIPE